MWQKISKSAVLLLALVSSAFAAKLNHLDHVVAVVNDQVILESDVQTMFKILIPSSERDDPRLPSMAKLKTQILKSIVDTSVQLQFADKAGINIDKGEIDTRIKAIAESKEVSVAYLYELLKESGVSIDEYRRYVKEQIIVENFQGQYIASDVTVSDAEIRGFLESPLGQDQSGVEYKVRHILLSTTDSSEKSMSQTGAQAQQIMQDLRKGADFAKIAMEKSSSPTALKGGDLGWRQAAQLPALFLKNVVAMKVGEVYGPIKTDSGYHIIMLEEKRFQQQSLEQEYHVQQILIKPSAKVSSEKAQQLLAQIRAKLEAGADFAKLARQYSDEKNTASKGGDLGWVTQDQMSPKFFAHIKELKTNIVSEPFESEQGWHLAILLSQRSQVNSIDAARSYARNVLFARKMQETMETWMKRAREQTKVEIVDQSYAKTTSTT